MIAVKPGRHAAAAQAAQTHTGALAGADIVVDAVLRRAGVIRVNDLEDLFTAAEITGRLRPLAKARVGIVTNGGGAGVLALDHMLDEACAPADLHPSTFARLEKVLPATWSHANPVDIIGDAPAERYAAAVAAVADDPGVDALLVLNCPTALASPLEAAQAVARLAVDGMVNTKPLVTCWLGKQSAEPARRLLQQRGIASVDTPLQAARAIAFLTHWSTAQAMLRRVPAARPETFADIGVASAIFERVAGEGRTMLTEVESKSLLSAYGVTVPETRVAGSAEEVGKHAEALLEHTSALVVKVLSRDITHKSDIGGVELGIRSAEGAKRAADRISARVQRAGARMDGFTIQPMISRPGATELIAGLNTDPAFGPVILFGAGGTSVEVIADTALELLPIDEVLAGDLIGRTRVARLLAGYRNQPPADTAAIISVLLALSQLAIDWPAVTSVDINPLIADADGVIALDARVAIDPARLAVRRPNPTLVIRPYPADACRMETVSGLKVQVRPIRPEDAGLYPDFLKRVDRDDLRRRFLHHMATISPDALERLSQLDYDRDMAFVALDRGTGQLYGISRYASDPDHQRAEFAILVRSDMQRRGLGLMLMRRLIDFARADGLDRLDGSILRENAAALSLCSRLGFKLEAVAGEPSLVRACLQLRPSSEAASAADSDQGHQRTYI